MKPVLVTRAGFTLVELLLSLALLAVAMAAIFGGYLGQRMLNEHARNLTLATQDAERVIEQLRTLNAQAGCTNPSAAPPAFTNWNDWLNAQDPTKSIPNPNPTTEERIVVTCQGNVGVPLPYCPATQMGTAWHAAGPAGPLDLLRITVAVCWRHRGRTIGECSWNGALLTAADANLNGVIESPVMLTTLVTCR